MSRWKRAAFGMTTALALVSAGSAGAGTVNYSYDVFGRLVGATYPDGTRVTYAYDAAGNRTRKQVCGSSNCAPTAVADSYSTPQGQALSGVNPLANDSDPDGDPMTITAAGPASNGTVSFTANSVTYTPNAGFSGTDSFGYTVSDGRGGTATGTVTVTVTAPPANQAPVANADTMNIVKVHNQGTAYRPVGTIDPRTNDSDPDGDTLTITAKTNGTKGTVTTNGTTVTYTYNTTTTGFLQTTDSFTYTISDGHGHTATATVTVNIDVETFSMAPAG